LHLYNKWRTNCTSKGSSVYHVKQLVDDKGDATDDKCLRNQFRCSDGTCLPVEVICDGVADCKEGEEENDCDSFIYNTTFQCGGNQTIHLSTVCNGVFDCRNGFDERMHVCQQECSISQTRCDSGQCIKNRYRCDGFYHCLDKSDESNCDPAFVARKMDSKIKDKCTIVVKVLTYWSSLTGYSHFPLSKFCLYELNIFNLLETHPLGTHLKHCQFHNCTGLFKCKSSYCLSFTNVCDGKSDCPHGDDEIQCLDNWSVCPGMLKCQGWRCVDLFS